MLNEHALVRSTHRSKSFEKSANTYTIEIIINVQEHADHRHLRRLPAMAHPLERVLRRLVPRARRARRLLRVAARLLAPC